MLHSSEEFKTMLYKKNTASAINKLSTSIFWSAVPAIKVVKPRQIFGWHKNENKEKVSPL